MLELKDRDALGRITVWDIGRYKIKLPNICIVINPGKMIVTPEELKKEFGAEIIITNSYIIKKNENLRGIFEEKGLHQAFGWNGPIYTDSGVFQMYSQGITDINQEEIIEFQKKIGSDIITPVDLFTLPEDSKKTAKEKIYKTAERIKSARENVPFLVGPIQGGIFLDLRAEACKKVASIKPDVFAIGGIVPLMENYNYKDLFDIILTCKQNLPFNAPIHAFGAGHPMVFAALTAFGIDIFDSAMYAIAAKRGGYLTVNGTMNIMDIEEFPCSCPICLKHTPEEVKTVGMERLLALHNLYVTFSEIRAIRNAIKGNYLWELVQQRVRAHPNLLFGFQYALKKYSKWIMKYDLFTKKSSLKWIGEESRYRPEFLLAKKLMKNVKSSKFYEKAPFGKIPIGLSSTYPFFQSIGPDAEKDVKVDNKTLVKSILDYQFGPGSSKDIGSFRIEVSKNTGRIRNVYKGKNYLGTIRSNDGLFLPSVYCAGLLKGIKKVYMEDAETSEIVKRGGSVLAKFVKVKDNIIIPGEEVAVCDWKGNIIGVGRALLSSDEMRQMERGIAVKRR